MIKCQMKLAIIDPVKNLLATFVPYSAANFLTFYDWTLLHL